MNNEEIARKLEEFQDYLSISNIFTDIIRWIAWVFVNGFAWIVDMLENLTDEILLIKTFYYNPEIVSFVDSIRPVLYIFLAFSLLYTGYLLIFNKKFNREGIAVKAEVLYPNGESALSGSVTQRNVTDLTEIDKSNWSKNDLTVPK